MTKHQDIDRMPRGGVAALMAAVDQQPLDSGWHAARGLYWDQVLNRRAFRDRVIPQGCSNRSEKKKVVPDPEAEAGLQQHVIGRRDTLVLMEEL